MGMLPEDRVARTMDLQEDIAAKLEILKGCAATEAALLPQGAGVDAHAQAFKDELKRITDYVTALAADTKIECDKYANVKGTSDEWVKKVDVLLKEWTLLDNTVTELN